MSAEELARKSADEILKYLGRDEATIKARFRGESAKAEMLLAGVVRELKRGVDNPYCLSPEQLKAVIKKKMDELFVLRKVLSEKEGDVPAVRRDINFEKYVTK